MSLAAKLKLIFLSITIFLLAQEWFSNVLYAFLLASFGFFIFFIAKIFQPSLEEKKPGKTERKRHFLYCISTNTFLWLPLLFSFLFLRFVSIPDTIIPPENWHIQSVPNWQKNIYIKAKIRSIFKPGTYLADMEILRYKKHSKVSRYKKHSRNSQKNNQKNFNRRVSQGEKKNRIEPTIISVYLHVNDYYLLNGCHVWLKLTRNHLFKKIPKNSFGKYLQRQGAVTTLRISRKNIHRKNCRNLDLRGKFENALGKTLYYSGFSLYERGVALGLILGKSSYMQKNLKKSAAQLGILHLFAASGLHMGIFFFWFFWPLSKFFGKKSRLALSLPLLPCFIYMFFLGFPVSLLRAFIFLSFHALQSFIHRKITLHDLILNSAICIVLLQPDTFLSLGTFLSFGAVTGILYFYPVFQKYIKNIRIGLFKPLLQQVNITICASLFTLPIVLYAFHGYSYSSFLANMLLVPFVSILMPLLIGALTLGIVSGGAILFLSKIARIAVEMFISSTEWLAQFNLFVNYDDFFCIPFFANATLLFSLFYSKYYNHFKINLPQKKMILGGVSLVSIFFLSPFFGPIEKYRQKKLDDNITHKNGSIFHGPISKKNSKSY